jgi:hypothetical protein
MKTRTLLLLSVGTALMILLAGGALLVQLKSQNQTVAGAPIGKPVDVGELVVTVSNSTDIADVFGVDVEIGGVDDDLSGFSLVTGDRRIDPLIAPADGRCTEITVEPQRCRLEFDTSAVDSSNRTLLIVRGDAQSNWQLAS